MDALKKMLSNFAVLGCLLWLSSPCACAPPSAGATQISRPYAQGPGADCLHVNTTTHRIVDSEGRERYFHGVNVVVKGPPWLPELQTFDPLTSFVEKDMQTLQELGLNAIRYAGDILSPQTVTALPFLQIWYDVAWCGATEGSLQ